MRYANVPGQSAVYLFTVAMEKHWNSLVRCQHYGVHRWDHSPLHHLGLACHAFLHFHKTVRFQIEF